MPDENIGKGEDIAIEEIEQPVQEDELPVSKPSPYPARITMLFAGDIMAHANNYRTGNFEKIWKDVAPLVQSADLSFANIEAPVADELGWDTYPEFNMKSEYPEAAINAGFNVFSLINNHTNDKRADGIEATMAWAKRVAEVSANGDALARVDTSAGGAASASGDALASGAASAGGRVANESAIADESAVADASAEAKNFIPPRQVYFSGIHPKEENKIDYTIIEKGEWKILFVAITEILNRHAETEYMNFVRVTEDARKTFAEKITDLKKENGCNFCVVSVHCNEPEYVRTVPQTRKNFYYKLLDAGADVVWANHPHVVQERELVGAESEREQAGGAGETAAASESTASKNTATSESTAASESAAPFRKLIMYANGNTISGQRRAPNFSDPNDFWEWTGDGVFILATFEIEAAGAAPRLVETVPYFITSYINTANQIIIKYLDDDFIDYLTNEAERLSWAKYITERKKIITEQTKEIKTWR